MSESFDPSKDTGEWILEQVAKGNIVDTENGWKSLRFLHADTEAPTAATRLKCETALPAVAQSMNKTRVLALWILIGTISASMAVIPASQTKAKKPKQTPAKRVSTHERTPSPRLPVMIEFQRTPGFIDWTKTNVASPITFDQLLKDLKDEDVYSERSDDE